jgi:uncharacterized repeat protein (TIGR02543 family)
MKPFEEINEFELDFPEAETGPIGSDYDEYSDIDVVAVVEELEENEDMVECKECFELFPKADCTKMEHGYVCPTCGEYHATFKRPELTFEFSPELDQDFPAPVDFSDREFAVEPPVFDEVPMDTETPVAVEDEVEVEVEPTTIDELAAVVADLVKDEIEAIVGYENAIAKVEGSEDIEDADKILDTLDHIKDEEEEHIDELEELTGSKDEESEEEDSKDEDSDESEDDKDSDEYDSEDEKDDDKDSEDDEDEDESDDGEDEDEKSESLTEEVLTEAYPFASKTLDKLFTDYIIADIPKDTLRLAQASYRSDKPREGSGVKPQTYKALKDALTAAESRSSKLKGKGEDGKPCYTVILAKLKTGLTIPKVFMTEFKLDPGKYALIDAYDNGKEYALYNKIRPMHDRYKELNDAEKFEMTSTGDTNLDIEEPEEPATPVVETIKVTFDAANDKTPAVVEVKKGEKVAKPTNVPEREGFTFKGWFNGEEAFDFEKPVEADLTLTAKWEKVEPETPPADDAGTPDTPPAAEEIPLKDKRKQRNALIRKAMKDAGISDADIEKLMKTGMGAKIQKALLGESLDPKALLESTKISFKNTADQKEFFDLCREIGILTGKDLTRFMAETGADDSNLLDKLREYRAELGDDFEITNEALDEEEEVTCEWCAQACAKGDCRHEDQLGWICSRCEDAIKSRGEKLTFTEEI